MSSDITMHVTVGSALGVLPFFGADDAVTETGVLMRGATLRAIDEAMSRLLQLCRVPRTADEIAALEVPEAVLQDAIDSGALRSGPARSCARWLGDARLHVAGTSLGFVDGQLAIAAPDGERFAVAPVYFWTWVFARTGRTIRELLDYVEETAKVEPWSEEESSAALVHMLVHGLATLDVSGR